MRKESFKTERIKLSRAEIFDHLLEALNIKGNGYTIDFTIKGGAVTGVTLERVLPIKENK